jgi:starvation-inducible DNA-binding protein
MAERLHDIVHDLPESKSAADLVALLNGRLADTADLYSQVKQAHWNVKGIHFMALHELFDQVAEAIEPYVDVIAERVAGLGGTARGTVRMAAAATSLTEYPLDADGRRRPPRGWCATGWPPTPPTTAAIERADDLEDAATEDLLTEIQRDRRPQPVLRRSRTWSDPARPARAVAGRPVGVPCAFTPRSRPPAHVVGQPDASRTCSATKMGQRVRTASASASDGRASTSKRIPCRSSTTIA